MNISERLRDIEFNIRELGILGVRRWTALDADGFPGLEQLFGSLTVSSPTRRHVRGRTVEDWNPIAQRMLMSDATLPPLSALELPLGTLSAHAQTFVEWAHEAIHVFSMEPWLTGERRLTDKNAFRQWYLAGEGLAYWYADIVVTRALRQAAPSLNLVFSRQAVSSASFHPETALAELGLTDAADLRDLYIEAFTGRWQHAGEERLARAFSDRVRDFYEDSAGTLGNLFHCLDDYGVLDGYWQRFCCIPGLPSLLPAATSCGWQRLDADQAHVWLGSAGLEALSRLDESVLSVVRLRRSLQLRAYYLWMLEQALRKGQIHGPSAAMQQTATGVLRTLLGDLERALHGLAEGASPAALDAVIASVNQRADEVLAGPLAGGVMAFRYWIFPAFAPTGGLIGLWTERSAYSDDEALAIATDVFERARRTDEVILLMGAFLQAMRTRAPDRAAALNRLLLDCDVRPTWTVDLADLSFSNDRFRECNFEFR